MVKFKSDGIEHVCSKKDLKTSRRKIHAKWSDGHYYEAEIVFQNSDKKKCVAFLKSDTNKKGSKSSKDIESLENGK